MATMSLQHTVSKLLLYSRQANSNEQTVSQGSDPGVVMSPLWLCPGVSGLLI